jgi:hypothetical protein
MDLGPLLVLGLMWLVVNAIRKAGSGTSTGEPPQSPPRPPLPGGRPRVQRPAPPGRAAADATATRPPRAPDATQLEGERLQQLLQQLGRTLEDAAGPAGRLPDRSLPPAEEQEERDSLEVTPEVRSLEQESGRAVRAEVDQDDEAALVVEQRRQAAEAHLAPRTRAEHQAFDARLRAEPADKTAVAPSRSQRLREAIIWREILGPPVSLRDSDER